MNTTFNTRYTMVTLVLATMLAAQLAAGHGALGARVRAAVASTETVALPQLPEVVVTARRLPSPHQSH